MVTDTMEIRSLRGIQLRAKGETDELPTIVGYAAVFGVLSEEVIEGVREVVEPGAFSRSLRENADIRATVDHDTGKIIGRRSAGTLTLEEDKRGLAVEIDPPNTQAGRDVVESVKRGDIDGMSFGFEFRSRPRWEQKGDLEIRHVEDVDLFEVAVLAFPAYPDTSAMLRSRDAWKAELEAEAAAARDRELRLLTSCGRRLYSHVTE